MPGFARATVLVTATFIGGFAASAVAAEDEASSLSVTIGAKEWASSWTTWRVNNVFFQTGPIQVIEPVTSGTEWALTPQLSLVYGKALLSTSYLTSTTYTLSGAQNSLVASRKELDANAGYYLLPGLAAIGGYKQITQDYGQGTYKWSGPIVGIAASAPIGSNWALYGTYVGGIFKLKLPAGQADAVGKNSFDAVYSLGELGIAYAVSVPRFFESLRVTLGYRAQRLRTKSYSLEAPNNAIRASDQNDDTLGFTLGISGTF